MKRNELLDAKGLLKELFSADCRPTVRWLRTQQKRRAIPFIKVGGLVRFDREKVREALDQQHTILPRHRPTTRAKQALDAHVHGRAGLTAGTTEPGGDYAS